MKTPIERAREMLATCAVHGTGEPWASLVRDLIESPDRVHPAFAAGLRFAAHLTRYAGSDVTPRSTAERERLARYLEETADMDDARRPK